MKPARHYPILWDAQLRHRMIKRLKSPDFARPAFPFIRAIALLVIAVFVYAIVGTIAPGGVK